jgi:hypothetical protein
MPSNKDPLRLATKKKRRRKEFIPSRLKRVGRAARKWELWPVPDWGIYDCWEGAFAFKLHSNSKPLFVAFAGSQWRAEERKFFQTVLAFYIYEAVTYQFLDELSQCIQNFNFNGDLDTSIRVGKTSPLMTLIYNTRQ